MRRDNLVLIIALVCGVVSFFAMMSFMKKQPEKTATLFVGTAMPLQKGTILTKDHLKLVPIKEGANAGDYFTSLDEVAGKELQNTLVANYPIKRIRVKTVAPPPPPPTFLPVPPGMRAMTVSAKEIENIPDPIELGMYVDVLGVGENNEGKKEMQTVVTGAKIISIVREKMAKKEEAGPVQSISLALNPQAVVQVTRAVSQGRVRLIVRPEGSDSEQFIQGAASMEIIRGVDKEKNLLSGPAQGTIEQTARKD